MVLIITVRGSFESSVLFEQKNKNKNNKFMRKLILTAGLGLAIFAANAQTLSPELVGSAGESFTNSSYQIAWSIGECVTATHTTGNYVLTQGFQQNTYVVTTVNDLRSDLGISVFPNPTNNYITLRFTEQQNFGKVTYSITDLSGRVLQTAEMKTDKEEINFSSYAVGTYFISVSQNNVLLKTLQIIKN